MMRVNENHLTPLTLYRDISTPTDALPLRIPYCCLFFEARTEEVTKVRALNLMWLLQ